MKGPEVVPLCEYCELFNNTGWGGPGCCETCDAHSSLRECTCPPHVAGADELAQALRDLLPERGNDVRLWPEDEQKIWREGDFSSHDEKREAVRAYRVYKAAIELGRRGYLKPSE